MKRVIACEKCSLEYHGYPASKEGPEEWVKKVKGKALKDYGCDRCGEDISKGSDCVAVSVFTDGIPYFVWEDEFIKRRRDDV